VQTTDPNMYRADASCLQGFPWWPVAVLKRQCYTRVREHVPSLVHKRGHQLVYFLGDEREDSV
jgi:hypothetical protein